MITGKHPGRRGFARTAVACFLEQTYQKKELLIINDSAVPLGYRDRNIREILLPFSPETTLGDLRNAGLERARGELIIQWDDDDWHDPERMEYQVSFWERGAAVLLKQQIRLNTITNTAFLYQKDTGIHGTILHGRLDDTARYPNLRKSEDTAFLRHFERRILVDSAPPLYIRLCHGENTWHPKHIMEKYASISGNWHLSSEDSEFLASVLKNYYPKIRMSGVSQCSGDLR